MLTGNKDLDQIILNKLDDNDLVNVCQTNHEADEICKDQNFWMNRILSKFPGVDIDILKEYKEYRTWSDYYIYDLRKLNFEYYELKQAANDGKLDHLIVLMSKIYYDVFDLAAGAAVNGHLDVLKYLVDKKGADISKENDITLRYTSFNGHTDVVKYLVEKGANIHVLDDFPLRHAAINGHLDTVKYLVDNGANIHADDEKYVLSTYKRRYGNVVDYLVSKGVRDPR